jgi:hypothetical protein
LPGAKRTKVRAYHLSDNDFAEFFGHADCIGYNAFKIKLGNPDFAWDMHRLNLLCCAVGPVALVMIDANEALVKTKAMHSAGFKLIWVEDPILRTDFEGLRLLRHLTPWTLINSGGAPDLFGGQSGVTDLAINDTLEKNTVDLSGESWAKTDGPLVAAQATVNSKLYGPTYWDTLGYVWVVNDNKKLFADNNLNEPTTFAELKAACAALLAAGIQPVYELVFPTLPFPGVKDKFSPELQVFMAAQEWRVSTAAGLGPFPSVTAQCS